MSSKISRCWHYFKYTQYDCAQIYITSLPTKQIIKSELLSPLTLTFMTNFQDLFNPLPLSRLFHHPRIYRHIHKIHHEWTAPIGIVAIYAHPLEHLMSNLGPIILGPLVMGSHIATAWMWFALALMTTINTHSGYHLPFMPSPEAHDFHHLKYVTRYLLIKK